MKKELELWMVRHGQTDWNLEGRYQGQADIPLNEQGIQQAYNLCKKLDGVKFSAIFCSDLKRARQTAEIVGAHLDISVRIDPRFREINQGEWEGQLVNDIKKRYLEKAGSHSQAAGLRPPGGETVVEVAQRMVKGAQAICEQFDGQRVLLVSHGLAVATLICMAGGLSLDEAYRQIPENIQTVKINWQCES